jgi:hypothetical protein
MTLYSEITGNKRDVTKVKIGHGNEAFELSTLVWENGDIEHILWDNMGEPIEVLEWALGIALVNENKREFIIGTTRAGIFHPAIGEGHFFATLIALASKYQESQF